MARNSEMTARQQEIVDVARQIIGSRGIDCLTVREIAKRLKISDGALYRHFKSKREILSLLIDDIELTLLGVINAAAEKEDKPAIKLLNVLFSHISYAEQRKGLTFIIINETLSFPDGMLRKKMYGVMEKYLGKIQDILIQGIDAGQFRKDLDVKISSLSFFGLVQSLVTFWALSNYEFPISKVKVQSLFEVYMEGVTV